MSDTIQADATASASIFGIPVVLSEFVPKAPRYEIDYSRPLVVRWLRGRMVDVRMWEEDQVFVFGGDQAPVLNRGLVMRPETFGVIRGLP